MSDYNTTTLSLEPGDSLSGRYRLERVIGEGGMAVVWLATDLNLDRPVAIKVLPTALSRDVRAITRLKAEAIRNLELTHANIVRLYSFEQDPVRGNQAYLVMQCVVGKTLHEHLAEHPDGLPKKQLQKWSTQIASAIGFAHERGVLHRDIKPSNIIIEESTGTAYLMDFGIARETRDTMTMVTGRQQESSGTLPYMSPQQLVGKNDKSNDIYSFAATLYEALCGHPPFYAGEIAYQIREIDPEPIESLPKAINDALLAGLAKDASKRPATCMAMLKASSTQKQADTTAGEGNKAGGKVAAKSDVASETAHKGARVDKTTFLLVSGFLVILVGLIAAKARLNDDASLFPVFAGVWLMFSLITTVRKKITKEMSDHQEMHRVQDLSVKYRGRICIGLNWLIIYMFGWVVFLVIIIGLEMAGFDTGAAENLFGTVMLLWFAASGVLITTVGTKNEIDRIDTYSATLICWVAGFAVIVNFLFLLNASKIDPNSAGALLFIIPEAVLFLLVLSYLVSICKRIHAHGLSRLCTTNVVLFGIGLTTFLAAVFLSTGLDLDSGPFIDYDAPPAVQIATGILLVIGGLSLLAGFILTLILLFMLRSRFKTL